RRVQGHDREEPARPARQEGLDGSADLRLPTRGPPLLRRSRRGSPTCARGRRDLDRRALRGSTSTASPRIPSIHYSPRRLPTAPQPSPRKHSRGRRSKGDALDTVRNSRNSRSTAARANSVPARVAAAGPSRGHALNAPRKDPLRTFTPPSGPPPCFLAAGARAGRPAW